MYLLYDIKQAPAIEEDSEELSQSESEEESSSEDLTHKTDNEEDREVADIFTDLLGAILLKNKKRLASPRVKTDQPLHYSHC